MQIKCKTDKKLLLHKNIYLYTLKGCLHNNTQQVIHIPKKYIAKPFSY